MSPLPGPGRLFAIGDLHGCVDELQRLLDEIRPASGDRLVFLGDYIDRGPDPKGVIDVLIELRDHSPARCIFLKGNHEDMFLAFLGEGGHHGDAFLMNGGRGTLASYGARPGTADVAARLPPAHLDFLRSLRLSYLEEPFLFVHAGISPLVSFDAQTEESLLWIRQEFIRNRHVLPYTVVFGHTPQREILWHVPWKIGLDTGAVYGNKLSCLELTSATLFEVPTGGPAVRWRSVLEELAPLGAAPGIT